MQTINAKRLLSQDHMHLFLTNISDNDPIIISLPSEEITTDKAGLYDFFKQQKYADLPDDAEILIANEFAVLEIVGYDYTWWNTTRRVNRLFSGPKKAKLQSTDNSTEEVSSLICVSIGYNVNDNISDVETFTGNRKQAVEWLNKQYQLYSIRAMFNKPIVISINDQPWQTINEYVLDGRIILA